MAKRKNERAKKNTVSIFEYQGLLRLRWRYSGKRLTLCTGLSDSPLNRHKSRITASKIEMDVASGHFDVTLNKYRKDFRHVLEKESCELSTAELFERFIDSRRKAGSGEYNLSQVYGTIWRYLKRFGQDIDSCDLASDFLQKIKNGELKTQKKGQPIKETTFRKYLSILQSCAAWAIDNDYWESDPFRKTPKIRTERNRASRAAFSDDERDRILLFFKSHTRYRHYYGYVSALFFLGFRISELIGLQWKHVDFDDETITICRSLSRGPDGKSSSRERQSKKTKGKTYRRFKLNKAQVRLLRSQQTRNDNPDDLVFPAPKGGALDDRNFRCRPWRDVLLATQVKYRPPYTARHTFATWAKRNGMTDEQLAYWMGHKTIRMVREHYGHLDENPVVPEFDIPLDS